jgi:hypothetical protein
VTVLVDQDGVAPAIDRQDAADDRVAVLGTGLGARTVALGVRAHARIRLIPLAELLELLVVVEPAHAARLIGAGAFRAPAS